MKKLCLLLFLVPTVGFAQSIKISALSALGAAPATGDNLIVLDVSDTSQGAGGSTKKMTIANLFTSPSFTTPTLGVATATSVNGLTITSSTGTLTITNAKTLSVSNTLTLAGTDGSTLNIGTGGTLTALATTSPGTGVATALGNAVNTTGGVVTVDGSATLTSKTLTSPTINTGTFGTSLTGGTDAYIVLDEHASAAGTAAAGSVRLYAKADGLLYSKDDAGTETLVSGGIGSFNEAGNYAPTGTWDYSAATVSFGTITVGTLNTTTITGAGGGITVDASGFDGNLATTDNTLQEIAQKLDDLNTGAPVDEAYDRTGWNGDNGAASKNNISDQLAIGDTDGDGKIDVLDVVSAAGFLSVSSGGVPVEGRTLTEGLAIDITNGTGASGNPTFAFDPTELLGSRTWGDGSTNTIVWTFDRQSGTDQTLTINDGYIAPSGLSFPVAAGASTLAASGQVAYDTTNKKLGIYNGTKEVAISTIYHSQWSFDPKAVCDGSVDRLFLMSTDISEPFGIHVVKWKLSFEADPTTEVDLDLKRADAFIGVANAAVMDVLDTTAGASSEATSSNINSDAVVANGKVLYLEFGTAYSETGHQCIFEMWWEVEED